MTSICYFDLRTHSLDCAYYVVCVNANIYCELMQCYNTPPPVYFLSISRIIDGLETLDELEKLPVNEKSFRPLTETRIKDVTLHANPFAG